LIYQGIQRRLSIELKQHIAEGVVKGVILLICFNEVTHESAKST